MNRPTPISVFSDQRRTKSITWSRASCGTQLPVRVPQDFFLARCAPPSTRPGLRPWSAPSSPRTQSVSASPPPGGGDAPAPERQPPRSRRTPFASGRKPSAAGPLPHTSPRPEPCPIGAASEWPPSPLRCNAFVPFSYVRSAILTDERFLHFQLRQDKNTKFIPVIFSSDDSQYIPVELRSAPRYSLASSVDYEKLYRLITSRADRKPGLLGPTRGIELESAAEKARLEQEASERRAQDETGLRREEKEQKRSRFFCHLVRVFYGTD